MSAVDPELVGRLFEEHASALELYARQWCDSPQDLVQEAFLKLFRQEAWPQKIVPWLFHVVRNEAMTAGRKARREQKYALSQAAKGTNWFRAAEESTIDPAELATALKSIAIEQREIIVAHIWGGLTFEEIAEVIGESSSTAHRHYQAGISALRERLGAVCPTTTVTPG